MKVFEIECRSSVDQRHWDDLASEFNGCFFHCYACGIYESYGPHRQPLFVKALDDSGVCIGIAVGRIEWPRFWPFSRFCKRAVFGALPATREKNPDAQLVIMAALEPVLRKIGVCEMHVGAFDSSNSGDVLNRLSYRLRSRSEFYIDLSRPIEEIWNALKPTKRTNIRKAQKLTMRCQVETSLIAIRQFLSLQKESMQRRGIVLTHDEEVAQSSLKDLLESGRAKLLVSYLDGIPVNAGLLGVFGSKAYYLAGGSSPEGNQSRGPVFLFWTAIEMLKNQGGEVLNLGGVSTSNDEESPQEGLYGFKQSFGSTVMPQPAGEKIISRLGAALHNFLQMVTRLYVPLMQRCLSGWV